MSIEIKKCQKPDGRERTLGTCLPVKQRSERKDKTWANQMQGPEAELKSNAHFKYKVP